MFRISIRSGAELPTVTGGAIGYWKTPVASSWYPLANDEPGFTETATGLAKVLDNLKPKGLDYRPTLYPGQTGRPHSHPRRYSRPGSGAGSPLRIVCMMNSLPSWQANSCRASVLRRNRIMADHGRTQVSASSNVIS